VTFDLHQLRRERGGAVYDGGRRWVGPGPGHSRRDASLSVMLASDGRPIVHSFAGDDFRTCASYLGLPDARPIAPGELADARRRREQEQRRREAKDRAFCAQIWGASVPIEGTPAEAYLWSRGLILDSPEVRLHPGAPRCKPRQLGDDRPEPAPHPAMIALVRDPSGQPSGIHATYITQDGEKAFGSRSRLMFGQVSGGAVRVEPMRDGVLAVGEGIETSAAFAQLKGVPTWACLSTSGLQSFRVPVGVRRFLIAADSDDSGAGMTAANALAERAQRVCNVEIHPAPPGQDWADVVVTHG
jgi:putative DNA primase/helicase